MSLVRWWSDCLHSWPPRPPCRGAPSPAAQLSTCADNSFTEQAPAGAAHATAIIVSDCNCGGGSGDMADQDKDIAPVDVDQEEEPNYTAPPEKSIDEMLKADQDDEALQKYKATLLGGAMAGSGAIVVEPDDSRNVIVKKLSLVVEGRDDATIDLTEDLATIKSKSFAIKEGVKFRIKIDFIVQREIVHGLKYVQKTYR